MTADFKKAFWSFQTVALAVGAAGFVSAFVSFAVEMNTQVAMRILVFVCWIFVTIVVILVKLIADLQSRQLPSAPFEIPIKFIPEKQLIIINKNEFFVNSIVVGCYFLEEGVETLAYIADVDYAQVDIIQLKIVADMGVRPSYPTATDALKNYRVRPSVPRSALQT